MDTWVIPYQRKAVPMIGGSVSAPLDQCTNNFETEDSSQCVNVEQDTRTGEGFMFYVGVKSLLLCCIESSFSVLRLIDRHDSKCKLFASLSQKLISFINHNKYNLIINT